MCGYLNKYSERPGSWLAGLLNKEWNRRFFCLYGGTLQYFKTEQDMLSHPRGHIELQVCQSSQVVLQSSTTTLLHNHTWCRQRQSSALDISSTANDLQNSVLCSRLPHTVHALRSILYGVHASDSSALCADTSERHGSLTSSYTRTDFLYIHALLSFVYAHSQESCLPGLGCRADLLRSSAQHFSYCCCCCCSQGARVEKEGRKRGHFWTFNIVRDNSRNGCSLSLVRCSTESHNVFEKWLTVSLHCNHCSIPALSGSGRRCSTPERRCVGESSSPAHLTQAQQCRAQANCASIYAAFGTMDKLLLCCTACQTLFFKLVLKCGPSAAP